MAENKVYIPASSGGIVNYFKESGSKVTFDPNYVIAAIIIILILEFILHKSSVFLG